MSYARFGFGSDVYIYEHYMGFIECCGCWITEPDEWEQVGFFKANTAREILDHIDHHIEQGHKVPERCIQRIKEEHPDLDAQIPPYVEDPIQHAEKMTRLRKKMRDAMMNSQKEEETNE